jgi:hypothetical protein
MNGQLGTFLLGVIAAVVLVMLWKKDGTGQPWQFPQPPMFPQPVNGAPASDGGCSGCGSPSAGANPTYQSILESSGTAGIVAAPGVPLGSPAGGGGVNSFYTSAGATPDTSFTFAPSAMTPGSPTVPAATTPVRSLEYVAPYSTGFHQHYNILGVPIKGYLQ